MATHCFPPFPMSHQHKALKSPCLSHLRRQRISTIYHGSLISLYLCFQMGIGAFQVQGPHEPLVAMLGGEAELPCFLLPPQSIKNMQISWNRSLPSQVVHLYEDGRDKPEEAMVEYLGRTELVKNVMHKGIVVLRILTVQPSDNGQYRCVIHHGSFYSDAVIELKVAALGSHPQFHVEVTESRQMQVVCKSEGWFPQPKVQWMDSEGREIPAESETHTQDKGGLFHVTASLLLGETSQKNLTCSVWNPVLNQKKEEQFSIAVAEPISTTITRRAGIALAALLIILTSTGLYLKILLKNRAKNRSGKHQHDTHHCIYQAVPPVTTDYAAAPADHVELYAESTPKDTVTLGVRLSIELAYACDGASADPPGTVLGNAAIGADTPKATDADLDPEANCTYPPGTAPTAQEDHSTNLDQDCASAHLPGAALHNAAPKATNADLDPEATCTYLPEAAPAEAHDTLYSNACKAPSKVRLWSKYDPEKEVKLRGSKERFTDLPISPYLQEGLEGIVQCELTNKLQPGSVSRINHPMQNRHPLENLSNFNIPPVNLGERFQANDLFESRNMRQGQVSPGSGSGQDQRAAVARTSASTTWKSSSGTPMMPP
ncbi:LOW QUALITY PROTEIN: hypothetical protein QTO34_003975 [Cnephaeus nilssonii]|uniref:Ig-like domain-containing protein n=1 Tax=Cnephaeus nilssonii TaxID=3371016 RepID=A0AA40HRY9_CNENI|nr:LOW QUALITY PROTEIN: hypothetical protein QTO34_003975 [Eptesicus nilssonii]